MTTMRNQMIMIRYVKACLAVFLICWSGWANAHEVRPAIFELTVKEDRAITLVGNINIEALLAGIGAEHDDTDDAPNAREYDALRALSGAQLEERFRAFAPRWINTIGLTSEGASVPLTLDAVAISETGDTDLARLSDITLTGQLPADADTLRWAYPSEFGGSVLRLQRPGDEIVAQFYPAGSASDPLGIAAGSAAPSGRTLDTFFGYFVYGFDHIVPKGLDHILFVLGLFLLSYKWRPLLAQVTAFTLAHTITLALGLFGIITLSPSIVEPLIALSIVYVAVENILTQRLHVWRPVVVFLFGLLHGLGFAGILSEVGLPRDQLVSALIAFNLGVEAGQLAVIAAAFVLTYAFMGKSWYRQRIVIPGSIAIGLVGLYWFLERTIL